MKVISLTLDVISLGLDVISLTLKSISLTLDGKRYSRGQCSFSKSIHGYPISDSAFSSVIKVRKLYKYKLKSYIIFLTEML